MIIYFINSPAMLNTSPQFSTGCCYEPSTKATYIHQTDSYILIVISKIDGSEIYETRHQFMIYVPSIAFGSALTFSKDP